MKRVLFSTIMVLGSYGSLSFLDENVVEKMPSTIGNQVDNKGRDLSQPKAVSKNLYSLEGATVKTPMTSKSLSQAIDKQITVLSRKRPFKSNSKFSGLNLTQEELRIRLIKTAEQLKKWTEEGADEIAFQKQFDLYKVNGFDQRGNIKFTAYYTPVFEVRTMKDEDFKYPIVKVLPIKDSITDKRLTEVVWTNNPKTASSIRMQGSGFIQYSNGQKELLKFVNTYKKKAKLPEDVTTDYNVFFQYFNYPRGSAGVSLTPQHSIAVDPKLIPYGSCLVSATPVIGRNGKFIRHEYKLLFAQDTGSMIKGMHVDYYTGVGEEAYLQAKKMSHYGKLWLILAKEE